MLEAALRHVSRLCRDLAEADAENERLQVLYRELLARVPLPGPSPAPSSSAPVLAMPAAPPDSAAGTAGGARPSRGAAGAHHPFGPPASAASGRGDPFAFPLDLDPAPALELPSVPSSPVALAARAPRSAPDPPRALAA
eukprot:tig00001222_g7596.t1